MGVGTITAGRILEGQMQGKSGEEHVLPFDDFPGVALVKTYNSNQQVSDSAGSMSAMQTGVKTRARVINIGPNVKVGDCLGSKKHRLSSLGMIAKKRGKAVGVVSTVSLTDATPATVYAQSPSRDWQITVPGKARQQSCLDIATQLMRFPFDIALGGGRAAFYGKKLGGLRRGKTEDLITPWEKRRKGHYVTTKDALLRVVGKPGPVLGLFADIDLRYMIERKANSREPTLRAMTKAAIAHLESRPGGYYLMVEGGKIDHGHHLGRAGYALLETVEFFAAIRTAIEMTNPKETMILVTADHSHVFTFAGYPIRGNPILGLVVGNDARGEPLSDPSKAGDGLPYTTLGYGNGPGALAMKEAPRSEPDTSPRARQQAGIPMKSETHSGEDVVLFASGPRASIVSGVIEQNLIFDIISYALGWSDSGS